MDPAAPRPGGHAASHRHAPPVSALPDGALWIGVDPYSAIVVRRGIDQPLSFLAAGLDAYLDTQVLPDGGVIVLGARGNRLELVNLDARGSLRTRHDLAIPAANPPLTGGQILTAYNLIRDSATGELFLWSDVEHALRAVIPRDLSLGPRITPSISPPRFNWTIHRGVARWVDADAARGPNALAFHEVPLAGGAPTSFALDPTIPTGDYDARGPRSGHDLTNDLRMARGVLPDGTLLFGASALVWVRPDGAAALSVPFEGVVRAGDGIAIAVPNASPPLTIARVERWVDGRRVNVVRPEERSLESARILSADAQGFALFIEMPYACMPGSGGLPNRIDTFTWSSPHPVREEIVGCGQEIRDSLRDHEGYANPLLATIAPDGAVLVPGADREGVFVVRVRVAAAPSTK